MLLENALSERANADSCACACVSLLYAHTAFVFHAPFISIFSTSIACFWLHFVPLHLYTSPTLTDSKPCAALNLIELFNFLYFQKLLIRLFDCHKWHKRHKCKPFPRQHSCHSNSPAFLYEFILHVFFASSPQPRYCRIARAVIIPIYILVQINMLMLDKCKVGYNMQFIKLCSLALFPCIKRHQQKQWLQQQPQQLKAVKLEKIEPSNHQSLHLGSIGSIIMQYIALFGFCLCICVYVLLFNWSRTIKRIPSIIQQLLK